MSGLEADVFASATSEYFNETYGEGWADSSIQPALDSNNAWMLQSGYMVFFMQAGFAMLCAGSVRAKNAKNIILLNILDACLGSLCWYATGYAFAYGGPTEFTAEQGGFSSTAKFIGNSNFFAIGLTSEADYAFWFFQFTFAATAATIVSGAVAERCRLWAYLSYELILVCFVYPVVAHWVWSSSGWASYFQATLELDDGTVIDNRLFGVGVCDFAGDGPVHMVGGIASLAAAWVLGPRIGRFDADGKPVDMPGHNASLTLLGVFFLWFGWFGFNPGSTLGIAGYSGLAARVAINTTFGAATGALTTLLIVMGLTKIQTGKPVVDLIMVGNGALAGLVSVTGPCGWIEIWAAIPIGIIGAFVYVGSSKLILNVFKVDDPLDAIAVHAGAGMWGLIATGAFATESLVATGNNYGFIMGGNGNLLACQIVIILAILAWTLGIMVPFFMILKKLNLFRVPPEVESAGLDVSHHGGSAYPHEPETAGSGVTITSDMIDRKIEDALARQAGGKGKPTLNNL
jgi:Amt family ammonium transporter